MEKCNIENTPYFSLNGNKYIAKVVNVIDGDTIVAIIYLFDNFYKFNIRLNGIDTCETKSSNIKIKNLGLEAKYRILELITNKKYKDLDRNSIINIFKNDTYLVQISCYDFDKYGRLLADIFINDQNISNILIKEKLAYSYDGKVKPSDNEIITNLKN